MKSQLFLFLPLITGYSCASRNQASTTNETKGEVAAEKSNNTRGEGWTETFEGGSAAAENEIIAKSTAAAVEAIAKNKAALKFSVSPRDAHPKAHGCVRGKIEILDTIPEDFKVGIFAAPQTKKVWARFSNAGLAPGALDDEKRDARGMAIKIIGIDGKKLALQQEDFNTFDINLVNTPTFPAETMQDYLKLQTNPASVLVGPIGIRLIAALAKAPSHHPFGFPYFSITPYMLGKKALKYQAKPCSNSFDKKIASGPNFMKESMKDAFSKNQNVCFELQAQAFVNDSVTSIENPAQEWKENSAPFDVTLAKISFEPQQFDSSEQQSFCENLSFNPWRVTQEHRPLGRFNRARQEVYRAVSRQRHKANQVTMQEPTGEESFPK